MSLKAELETWAAALNAYDEENFEQSLELFSVSLHHSPSLHSLTPAQRIADSSKILTNMGLIYATLGEHEAAVERFIEATGLDQFLAVASVLSTRLFFSISSHPPSADTFNAVSLISCYPATTGP